MKSIKSVSVCGLGKLGACMAATFAARGFSVVGVDIDPEKIKEKGEDIEFSLEMDAGEPADISDWRERDVGMLRRLRFRFGQKGNYLDIQTPLKANGDPLY